jgi:hypothetical protein
MQCHKVQNTQTHKSMKTPTNHPGVHRVAQIISRRDNEPLDDCIEEVLTTQRELLAAIERGSLEECYDILIDNLGLEGDFLDDLVFSQI